MLNDQQRHQIRVQFDTRKETGMSVTDAKNAVDGTLLTPNQALFQMGFPVSKDPNMDRMQSNLNDVFLDKKEEYQAAKGGDSNDNRFGKTSSDNENSDQSS